jgi:hypothetical protein
MKGAETLATELLSENKTDGSGVDDDGANSGASGDSGSDVDDDGARV